MSKLDERGTHLDDTVELKNRWANDYSHYSLYAVFFYFEGDFVPITPIVERACACSASPLGQYRRFSWDF